MKRPKIVHENGDYWATEEKDGTYRVHRNEGTASRTTDWIGFKGAEGLRRARAAVDTRAGAPYSQKPTPAPKPEPEAKPHRRPDLEL